jgi:hypothetical protein
MRCRNQSHSLQHCNIPTSSTQSTHSLQHRNVPDTSTHSLRWHRITTLTRIHSYLFTHTAPTIFALIFCCCLILGKACTSSFFRWAHSTNTTTRMSRTVSYLYSMDTRSLLHSDQRLRALRQSLRESVRGARWTQVRCACVWRCPSDGDDIVRCQ